MKTLWLRHDYEQAAKKLKGEFPAPSHVDPNKILDEDTKVIAPHGRITALLLTRVIPPELHKRAYHLWREVDGLVSNRATAVGTLSLPRSTNKEGTPSPRRGVNTRVLAVLKARQGILGYLDRPCAKTLLTARRPEMLEGNERLTKLVDHLYKKHLPEFYATQRAVVEKAPSRRLWNTAFTTI